MKLKNKYLSKVIRKYIKAIKNNDIREVQKSIYARYINIEKIKNIKTLKKKFKKDFTSFQKDSEHSRNQFFVSKKVIKKSSVYFSDEYINFSNNINELFLREITKKDVIQVFLDFKNNVPDVGAIFLHLTCSILNSGDLLTLTNFKIQLRNVAEKQYLFFNTKHVTLKESNWFQFSDIIIEALTTSKIICIEKKVGERKKKHLIDYVRISNSFQTIALAYDYKASNMPLIVKPNPWVFSKSFDNIYGGFLVNQTDLIVYNKEKSLMTKVNSSVLSNLNYLQQIPYKINKTKLKEILSDFGKYLESVGIKIHLYEDVYEFNLVGDNSYNYKSYNLQLKEVKKIIESLEQAIFLSNFPYIYFTLYLDFRTRLYYHGWPINPQGNKLVRSLLLFGNQRKKNVVKELDVSASGLQIIGGLLYNINYLKQTNLIKYKNASVSEKNDIYSVVLSSYIKYRETSDGKNIEKLKKFFDRKIFKSIIMCYFYNETHFGVVKKLENIIGSNNKILIGFNLHSEVKLVRHFIKSHFQDFEFLKEIVSKVTESVFKTNKAINLINISGSVSTFQFYAKQESVRINYYNHFGNRLRITVSRDILPITLNKGKTRRATLPNLIHNIDALLLHDVLKKVEESGIFITVIHDCFIVHKKNEKKLKQLYFESFKDLLLLSKSPLLIEFLKQNLSLEEYKLLKTDIEMIFDRKNKFISNIYDINPFVLTE
jgi:hypothetical protein